MVQLRNQADEYLVGNKHEFQKKRQVKQLFILHVKSSTNYHLTRDHVITQTFKSQKKNNVLFNHFTLIATRHYYTLKKILK